MVDCTFKLYFFEQNFFSRVFRTNFENKFENRNKKRERERMIEYHIEYKIFWNKGRLIVALAEIRSD